MDRYPAPVGTSEYELEIKRSRFVVTFFRVSDAADARLRLEQIRKQYSDASHHCWAMIAGSPLDVYQQDQSDDGEPKGTAGKPMLNVLSHSGLGNVLVVVTRYFGGIKLGAGGLVRAYSRSVSEALGKVATEQIFVSVPVAIGVPYNLFGSVEHWLSSSDIAIVGKKFDQLVQLELLVPESGVILLHAKLAEIGGGRIVTLAASD